MINQRHVRNRGFTDKLYFINLTLTWIYTLLCMLFTLLGKHIGIEDYSFVSIVCPLIWAELTVHTGFVVYKAKCENLRKFTGDSVVENASMNISMEI